MGKKYDPYRPAIAVLPVDWDGAKTEKYNGIDSPAKRVWVGIVYGSDETHDLCETVAVPLLPKRCVDDEEVKTVLREKFESKEQNWKDIKKQIIENYGFDAQWINQDTDFQLMISNLFRTCFLAQMAEGEANHTLLEQLSQDLPINRTVVREMLNSSNFKTIYFQGHEF